MGKYQGLFDVMAFGADPTGSIDSTAAFNAAINAAGASVWGTGTIYVPAGKYNLAGTSPLVLNNMMMIGDNANNASILNFTSVTGYCVTLEGGTLEHLQLQLDATGSGLIRMQGGTSSVRKLVLVGFNGAAVDPTPITINNSSGTDNWVDNIQFFGVTLASGEAGMISLTAGTNANIRGVMFADSCKANAATNQALVAVTAGVSQFIVTELQPDSDTTYNYGVYIATGSSDNYIVVDNNVAGATTAPVHDGGSGTNKLVDFNPLQSFGSTAANIGISAGGSAVTPSHSDHVHATGAGTPSTQAFGDSASTGTGPAAAMTDHKHGMPLGPATGTCQIYCGRTVPTGALACSGQLVSRTTYANLFNVLNPAVGTCTITIASPAVVTLNGHGFATGDSIYLTTTGSLPTGLTANTQLYYVTRPTTNTFKLTQTIANAFAGTSLVNTSGSQSGTHTVHACPYGLGDGSTNFAVPDFRGCVIAGPDSMYGSTAAGRLNATNGGSSYGTLGDIEGTQGSSALISHAHSHNHGSHHHSPSPGTAFVVDGSGVAWQSGTGFTTGQTSNTALTTPTTDSTAAGSGSAYNIVQPTAIANYIIWY